ncbi:MAG: DUF853 domain-containing protein [Alphaproteobacteria bacterium]|nr:DUF853 domain-containing protein [Alphaproteobacteria bacterium]MBU0797464.1 DUF853 domain-containing protein [Alphaproteobacteria bacterium]MBU0889227.1 DUF853 domain-containing protein [Alphaproteobacteria bacterium]MBU1813816.1 DUF853 domain-containing protein [Alphaproteobacteria bacterium]
MPDSIFNGIFIGGTTEGAEAQRLPLSRANRHGLIAGATGTGKTVSLQVLAEGFSAAGVPVFLADVKGDLAGISQKGEAKPVFTKRAEQIGLNPFELRGFPTVFWDLYGISGHPIRTTISEFGPLMLSRLLELTEAQAGVLDIAFQVADDEGMLLLDLKDLRAMLAFLGEQGEALGTRYGNVAKASVGAIQRALLGLERQDGEMFFGEPAFQLADFMRQTYDGFGTVNILAADRLIQAPRLYATFLLWLLSELFEELPEVGDVDKPKLVFVFDEAHLLFTDAPKALVAKVAQVVRLIRSKGVGVYFVTQSPADIPEEVLGQLGNRIQHALRAFTPKEQRAVRSAADTFRPNPAFDASRVITELGVGEALVSLLDAKGAPGIVQRTLIRPPSGLLGPIAPAERQRLIGLSPVGPRYDTLVDRDSAYEMLARRAQQAAVDIPAPTPASKPARTRESPVEAFAKSVARAVGSQIGRAIFRGVLGSLSKKR